MKKFAATLEELAVQQLEDDTLKAEGESPQKYEEFIEQTEANAIVEREKLVEEKKEEEGFDDATDGSTEIGEDTSLETGVDSPPEDNGLDAGDPPEDGDASDQDAQGDEDEIDDAEAQAELVDTKENLNALASGVSGAAGFITSSVGDIMSGLGRLGIKYTPVIASLMYKGVVWMFSRFGTLVYRTGVALGKYIESNLNSVDRLNDRLDACSDQLKKLIESGQSVPKDKYTNKAVINRLKVGGSVAVAYNIDNAVSGLEVMIKSLVEEAKNSYNIIEKLAETNPDNGPKHMDQFMEIDPHHIAMEPGYVAGFENETGLVVQYRSKSVFPGDMVFMLNAPQCRNRDMEGIAEAYREASTFLAADSKSIKLVESMNYMSAHELIRAIQSTRKMITMMRDLTGVYRDLQKVQPSLAYSVKKLFLQLADDEAKTRLSSSYIEPMYLRSAFASSVLLSGVMDLNTYASRVAAASITLVEEHIRKMS